MTNNLFVSTLKRLVHAGFGLLGLRVSRLQAAQNSAPVRYILTDLAMESLTRRNQKLVVIDGGARDALTDDKWLRFRPDQLRLYGFEVDSEECNRLNEEARRLGQDFHCYPTGLWSHEGVATFYKTKEPGGSSFFKPNNRLTDRWMYFQGRPFTEILAVADVCELPVTTLASWQKKNQVPEIDFIKLNVQGAELEILKGAGTSLDGVVGLQIEMSFGQTYVGGPLFADLDTFLRDSGFAFFDCLSPNYVGRVASPVRTEVRQAVEYFRWPSRQLFEGHFLYLRDPIGLVGGEPNVKELSPDKALKLACFAEMWGQVEFAFEILKWLAANLRTAGNAAQASEIEGMIQDGATRYVAMAHRIPGLSRVDHGNP